MATDTSAGPGWVVRASSARSSRFAGARRLKTEQGIGLVDAIRAAWFKEPDGNLIGARRSSMTRSSDRQRWPAVGGLARQEVRSGTSSPRATCTLSNDRSLPAGRRRLRFLRFGSLSYSSVVRSRYPHPRWVRRAWRSRFAGASPILAPRRHSSVVEQLFRKQQVLGSSPSVGSTHSRTTSADPDRLAVDGSRLDPYGDPYGLRRARLPRGPAGVDLWHAR